MVFLCSKESTRCNQIQVHVTSWPVLYVASNESLQACLLYREHQWIFATQVPFTSDHKEDGASFVDCFRSTSSPATWITFDRMWQVFRGMYALEKGLSRALVNLHCSHWVSALMCYSNRALLQKSHFASALCIIEKHLSKVEYWRWMWDSVVQTICNERIFSFTARIIEIKWITFLTLSPSQKGGFFCKNFSLFFTTCKIYPLVYLSNFNPFLIKCKASLTLCRIFIKFLA